MPAGDLITGDWQVEIRTTLMGNATYPIRSIDGVSLPPIVTNDLPKLLADGEFQGINTYGPRFVTITFDVVGTSAANLETSIATLETAWAVSSSDIYFVVRLGGTKKRCSGRPIEFDRPVINPVEGKTFRAIGGRAQFKAGNPTWTTI